MRFGFVFLFVVATLLMAACSSGEEATPTLRTVTVPEATEAPAGDAEPAGAMETEASESTMLPAVDPLSVSGDIVTAGSSTVFPLSERMAERFQDEGYSGNITIDSIGSGAGFERFCVAGETDSANAGRPIRDTEIESCQAIGRELLEFQVGTDALARPLFIYSTAGIMAEKPQVAAFINFYLTYIDDEIEDVGYFPSSVEGLEQSKMNWLAALG